MIIDMKFGWPASTRRRVALRVLEHVAAGWWTVMWGMRDPPRQRGDRTEPTYDGATPPCVDDPEMYAIRSASVVLPRETDWIAGTSAHLKAFSGLPVATA